MRFFRTCLFVLLSIALPLQGYAQFVVPKVPCPMEPMAMMDADAMHDCCNDAETATKTGKPCKSAQFCSSVGQFLPFPENEGLPQSQAASSWYSRLADIAFTFDPTATWRPPAQL
ncbi:MAG: hypothetical protein B7X93_08315 [Hydrogenophilales bacterium 17-61-9]|nr:MAG: hypothetical protein B7X93_08315 [Hydrogenophilales bacterium 17-61-9]